MSTRLPNLSQARTGSPARSNGTASNGLKSGRRLLANYAAVGSGPVELLTAVLGRAANATKRWPEPWRRILWGQQQ